MLTLIFMFIAAVVRWYRRRLAHPSTGEWHWWVLDVPPDDT